MSSVVLNQNIEEQKEKPVQYKVNKMNDAAYLLDRAAAPGIHRRVLVYLEIAWRAFFNRSGYLTGVIQLNQEYFQKTKNAPSAQTLASAWEYIAAEIRMKGSDDSKAKDQAIEHLEESRSINPNNHRAVTNLAELYYQTGQYQKSLECWQDVLKLVEREVQTKERVKVKLGVTNVICKCLSILGKIEEMENIFTEEFFAKYEKDNPSIIANSYSRMATAYLTDISKAKYYLDKAQNLVFHYLSIKDYNPDKPLPTPADDNLALLYNKRSLFAQANEDFDEALKYREACTLICKSISSRDYTRVISNYFNLVNLKLEMNSTDKVLKILEEMQDINLNKLNINKYYTLAIDGLYTYYYLLYDYINRTPGGLSNINERKANEFLDEIYTIYKNNAAYDSIIAVVYCYWGNAYIKYGMYNKAMTFYELSLKSFEKLHLEVNSSTKILIAEKIKSLNLIKKTKQSEREYLIEKLEIKKSILPIF